MCCCFFYIQNYFSFQNSIVLDPPIGYDRKHVLSCNQIIIKKKTEKEQEKKKQTKKRYLNTRRGYRA